MPRRKTIIAYKKIQTYNLPSMCSFKELADAIIEKGKEFPEDAKVSIYYEDEYGETSVYLGVYYNRKETAYEAQMRREQEERHKIYKREQYERLKKEFGD